MTLGKGLESLIPPRKPQTGQLQQSQQFQQSQQLQPGIASPVQAPTATPVQLPASNPAPVPVDLPVLPSEPAKALNEIEIKTVATTSAVPDTAPRLAPFKEPVKNYVEPQKSDAIFQIEVDQIRSNPHQPRRYFEEEGLRELASSIREFGVLQPIIVSKIEMETENGRTVEYELIAGERRLMASKLAGLRTIPAIIRRLTPEREKLEIAIIENIQRRNLDPIEEAKAFARLQDEFRLTQREIAAKLGKSREAVANAVRLLNLPSDIQQALSERKISESQGRLLLSIQDIGEQRIMFEDILRGGLSVREVKAKLERKKEERSNEIVFARPETLALKEKLEEFLGTKVDFQEAGDKGKITISFYSKEELQAIIDKLFQNPVATQADNLPPSLP